MSNRKPKFVEQTITYQDEREQKDKQLTQKSKV